MAGLMRYSSLSVVLWPLMVQEGKHAVLLSKRTGREICFLFMIFFWLELNFSIELNTGMTMDWKPISRVSNHCWSELDPFLISSNRWSWLGTRQFSIIEYLYWPLLHCNLIWSVFLTLFIALPPARIFIKIGSGFTLNFVGTLFFI